MGEPKLQPGRGEAAHRRGSTGLQRCLRVIVLNTSYPGGWSVFVIGWDSPTAALKMFFYVDSAALLMRG